MGHLARTRAGWNAERLAEYLLAKIAFVASPTTISDNIGIDFSCTLLDTLPGEHAQLVPTLPFLVQVKSSGTKISLTKYLPMLRQTPLPFMIATADVKQNRLRIYSGRYIRFAFAWFGPHPQSFVARLVRSVPDARGAVQVRRTKPPQVRVDFPKLAELAPGSRQEKLERIREQLEAEVLQIGLNNYNSLVDQFLFRFPRPRAETRVLAGSGSARRFRHVMADRLTEYARNVWWLGEHKGESVAKEALACMEAARVLRPYIPRPRHLQRALKDLAPFAHDGGAA